MSGRSEASLSAVALGALAGAAVGLALAGASAAVALAFTRRVVTPARHRPDDVEVLAVLDGATGEGSGAAAGARVVLRIGPITRTDGRYGLWTDGGRVHSLVGDVLEIDEDEGTLSRRLLGDAPPVPGPGRWTGSFYAGDPTSALGLDHRDVHVHSPVGDVPAWFVPAASGAGEESDTWAVLVHGRGATREECLRALPVLNRLGVPALVTSYRNDAGAPPSPAGRYGLGDTEWVDVEAAVLHALDSGARDVVLIAWSMGAAICLSFLSRSWTADRVRAMVLDAPVLDWRDVLDHQARINRVPTSLARSGLVALGSPLARAAVGVGGPVDLGRLDWVARADELSTPVLVLHSEDDEFVPFGPSAALAQARPDLVRLVPFTGAAHCREWNVDPARWDREVARFLLEHL